MYKTFVFISLLAAAYGCGEPKSQTETISPTTVIVDASSSYVMTGDTFHAQLIAVNAKQWKDKITIETEGELAESHWEDGILKVSIITEQPGLKKFSGNLKVKTVKGDTLLPFSTEYTVASPALSFRTKYLIKDMDNPVEIGMAGIPPFFELSASDAEISGDFGQYTINPHKTGIFILNVKSKDGITDYGNFEFEVFEKK